MKRTTYFIILLVALTVFGGLSACSSTSTAGTAYQDPPIPTVTDETGWWIDTTGRVSQETIDQLNALSEAYNADGFQIAGVFFSDSSSEGWEIATDFGNANGIGYGDKDNGIVVAVFLDKAGASGEKAAIAVATGDGIAGTLNDGKVGEFLDETFVPKRSEGKWEQGVILFVEKTHRYLQNPNADEFRHQDEGFPWGKLLVILLIVIILVALNNGGGGTKNGTTIVKTAVRLGNNGTFGGTGTQR